MKLSDFDKARVGDRVWDLRKRKWGEIININHNNIYPITVKYNDQLSICYNLDGKEFNAGEISDLYWDEIKFEVPEMPKRKVKVLKYMNIYQITNIKGVYQSGTLYKTITEALTAESELVRIATVPIEFEVEE